MAASLGIALLGGIALRWFTREKATPHPKNIPTPPGGNTPVLRHTKWFLGRRDIHAVATEVKRRNDRADHHTCGALASQRTGQLQQQHIVLFDGHDTSKLQAPCMMHVVSKHACRVRTADMATQDHQAVGLLLLPAAVLTRTSCVCHDSSTLGFVLCFSLCTNAVCRPVRWHCAAQFPRGVLPHHRCCFGRSVTLTAWACLHTFEECLAFFSAWQSHIPDEVSRKPAAPPAMYSALRRCSSTARPGSFFHPQGSKDVRGNS